MKRILKLLTLVFIFSSCADFSDVELSSGRVSYSNPCIDSIDACFEESIISYEYAVWDILNKEWIELDYVQSYAGFSEPVGSFDLFPIDKLFALGNKYWHIKFGFSSSLSYDNINSNNFTKNYHLTRKSFPNSGNLFLFDGHIEKVITTIDTTDIAKFVSNREDMYLHMKSKQNLQKFDPIRLSLSETSIDTSIISGVDYIKLIEREALFCDLNSYIKFINIDTGLERNFSISVDTSKADFKTYFFHKSLDNVDLDNGKIYLSSLYIEEIEGMNTGQSSFIEIDGNTINLIPLPGFAQESYAIQNAIIYFEMDFTSIYETRWDDNDLLNRIHYLEIATGDIYNMNGGLCCGCLNNIRDIRGIAANDNYVAVTGGFCKAGRDENKKIN